MDAETIIKIQETLENQDSSLRSRWQDTANYIFPRESNITTLGYTFNKYDELFDTTAITARTDMTSGLLTNLVPAGQKFFSLATDDEEDQEIDDAKSYMAYSTSALHEELFTSNFILQLTETLDSLITFGTGNNYSEWSGGLNFMDWDISLYQVLENFRGQIDTIFLKFHKTAKQAYAEWGKKAGKSILDIMEPPSGMVDEKKINDKFWFIHVVRPRQWRNPRLEDNLNMPFESGYISVKDKVVIEEGGYMEFPYAIPRWTKTSGEVHGRGIGTMILPQVKMVNANKRDFNEVGNKYANPHREVISSFQGEYKTYPGARNDVTELPSSHVDERNFGNFPITKDILEMERQVIKDAFYQNAFAPMTPLTGDRRNELEIRQRIMEAFRKIGSPIGRLESELFTPLITRCYYLMVRNGAIEPPPEILQGRKLKILYKGPLSLAQQNAEVTAVQDWMGAGLELEQSPSFAGIVDNINIDNAYRRMGRIYGVNEDDIATTDEVEEKRMRRQQEAERQKALETAQIAAQSYGQTTKAPEEGSAAERMG